MRTARVFKSSLESEVSPTRRWNLTGDYGSHAAFQFPPLTDGTDSIRGGHMHFAPELGEVFGPIF
jgi:hypothetical protein